MKTISELIRYLKELWLYIVRDRKNDILKETAFEQNIRELKNAGIRTIALEDIQEITEQIRISDLIIKEIRVHQSRGCKIERIYIHRKTLIKLGNEYIERYSDNFHDDLTINTLYGIPIFVDHSEVNSVRFMDDNYKIVGVMDVN